MSIDWSRIVQEAMPSQALLELPKRLKLPVVPQAVVEFTARSDDPNAGPRALAVPLEADAALTTELLRQVNSAAFGLRQNVTSVAQAINLLGPRRTKTLVLTAALQSAMRNMSSRLLNMAQFHRDNVVRASFAREAATQIGADLETAYIAGLLQDFLLPLLMSEFESDYQHIIDFGGDWAKAEQLRLGWDHATLAAGLMQDWSFPDEVVLSVLWHHSPEKVLAQPELMETAITASIAAATLPDTLRQSPDGFAALLAIQGALPDFCFLEAANAVDEELLADNALGTGLCDQLANLAEDNLAERRLERVQRQGQLGNYTLGEEIARGGMGVVYGASHCMLKRPAAIKILNAAKIRSGSLAQFEAEVQLTCRLTSPHTIAVYDYGVTPEGLFYYAMEYLDGITLSQLVHEDGPQSAGRVIHLLQQVSCSLVEAHSLGLIHRDLKPENLMLCFRGGVPDMIKVLDFGLAKIVSKAQVPQQVTTGFAGTPHYSPPEAIHSPHLVDARSDIYSLGMVMYCLLTGQPAFNGDTVSEVLYKQLHEMPRLPSNRINATIDLDLEQLIMRCLAKTPESRPQSIEEFESLLNACQSAKSWGRSEASQWWLHRQASQACSTNPAKNVLAATRKMTA